MTKWNRVARMSRLFMPKHLPDTILKEDRIIEATIKNPQQRSRSQVLMMSEGLIHNVAKHPGMYTLLPLAMRSRDKLIKIVDDHMQAIGAQCVQMPSLINAQLWQKTGRWDSAGSELFRLKDRSDASFCLGPTHEEVVTSLVKESGIVGFRRFPFLLYQITSKFRDEPNPRFGLLRGREFLMKDLYSFDVDEEQARNNYEIVCDAYEKIFKDLHLDAVKVRASTGAIGGSYSHEYHLFSPSGEDRILCCSDCGQNHSVEFIREQLKSDDENSCPSCQSSDVQVRTSIEVGHTFLLGTRYSMPLGANFRDLDNKTFRPLHMGCYGLGISRILAASVESLLEEISHDSDVVHHLKQSNKQAQKGESIRWPEPLVPYTISILPPKEGSKEDTPIARSFTESVSQTLNRLTKGDVIVDDRCDLTIGRRVRDSLAIGIPYIVVLGKNFNSEPYPLFELVRRIEKESPTSTFVTHHELIDFFDRKIAFTE